MPIKTPNDPSYNLEYASKSYAGLTEYLSKTLRKKTTIDLTTIAVDQNATESPLVDGNYKVRARLLHASGHRKPTGWSTPVPFTIGYDNPDDKKYLRSLIIVPESIYLTPYKYVGELKQREWLYAPGSTFMQIYNEATLGYDQVGAFINPLQTALLGRDHYLSISTDRTLLYIRNTNDNAIVSSILLPTTFSADYEKEYFRPIEIKNDRHGTWFLRNRFISDKAWFVDANFVFHEFSVTSNEITEIYRLDDSNVLMTVGTPQKLKKFNTSTYGMTDAIDTAPDVASFFVDSTIIYITYTGEIYEKNKLDTLPGTLRTTILGKPYTESSFNRVTSTITMIPGLYIVIEDWCYSDTSVVLVDLITNTPSYITKRSVNSSMWGLSSASSYKYSLFKNKFTDATYSIDPVFNAGIENEYLTQTYFSLGNFTQTDVVLKLVVRRNGQSVMLDSAESIVCKHDTTNELLSCTIYKSMDLMSFQNTSLVESYTVVLHGVTSLTPIRIEILKDSVVSGFTKIDIDPLFKKTKLWVSEANSPSHAFYPERANQVIPRITANINLLDKLKYRDTQEELESIGNYNMPTMMLPWLSGQLVNYDKRTLLDQICVEGFEKELAIVGQKNSTDFWIVYFDAIKYEDPTSVTSPYAHGLKLVHFNEDLSTNTLEEYQFNDGYNVQRVLHDTPTHIFTICNERVRVYLKSDLTTYVLQSSARVYDAEYNYTHVWKSAAFFNPNLNAVLYLEYGALKNLDVTTLVVTNLSFPDQELYNFSYLMHHPNTGAFTICYSRQNTDAYYYLIVDYNLNILFDTFDSFGRYEAAHFSSWSNASYYRCLYDGRYLMYRTAVYLGDLAYSESELTFDYVIVDTLEERMIKKDRIYFDYANYFNTGVDPCLSYTLSGDMGIITGEAAFLKIDSLASFDGTFSQHLRIAPMHVYNTAGYMISGIFDLIDLYGKKYFIQYGSLFDMTDYGKEYTIKIHAQANHKAFTTTLNHIKPFEYFELQPLPDDIYDVTNEFPAEQLSYGNSILIEVFDGTQLIDIKYLSRYPISYIESEPIITRNSAKLLSTVQHKLLTTEDGKVLELLNYPLLSPYVDLDIENAGGVSDGDGGGGDYPL